MSGPNSPAFSRYPASAARSALRSTSTNESPDDAELVSDSSLASHFSRCSGVISTFFKLLDHRPRCTTRRPSGGEDITGQPSILPLTFFGCYCQVLVAAGVLCRESRS